MTPIDMAHEGIVLLRQFTHNAFLLQFLQSLDRKDDVDVFFGIAVIVVIVSNSVTVKDRRAIENPEARVAFAVLHVKRRLV